MPEENMIKEALRAMPEMRGMVEAMAQLRRELAQEREAKEELVKEVKQNDLLLLLLYARDDTEKQAVDEQRERNKTAIAKAEGK